jgi:hypothetical protein
MGVVTPPPWKQKTKKRSAIIIRMKMISKRLSVFYTHTSVILTLTSVIYTRRIKFQHAQDWFLHAE